MASFVYQGMNEKEKKALFEKRKKEVHPQDKRGETPVFKINSRDSEEVKEEKRKRVAKWHADREKEIKEEIEAASQSVSINGVLFVAGKDTHVEDGSPLCLKMQKICAARGSVFKVSEKKEK